MSPHASDLEDSCRTLEDEVARLNREKDEMEERLGAAEDLLRWVIEHAESARSDKRAIGLVPFAAGFYGRTLENIAIQAQAFLEAGEAIYKRPANLPVCTRDKFGLPCPTCEKLEPDCECAETDEESVAKAVTR